MDAERRDPGNGRLRELMAALQADYRNLASQNRSSISTVRRRVTWLLSFNLAVLFALIASTFYLRGQDSERALEGKRLALAIQQNRVQTISETCREGNHRHDETIKTLNRLLARALARATTQAQKAQIERSRASTTLLINALAPRRDCAAVVRDINTVVR